MDHGEEIEVTDRNKVQYLNLLAQYRLSKCVKEEIEYFLKGMTIVWSVDCCMVHVHGCTHI